MSIEIHTGRLLLRSFVSSDWRDLLETAVDKASSQYAIYDHQFPTSETEVKRIAGWFATRTDFLAVYEPSIRKVIGYIHLGGDNPAERDLGYTFHSRHWGKGYAAEACAAAIDHAFSSPAVRTIRSGTAKLNAPSVKLLRSLGFKETGEAVGSFANDPQGQPIQFVGLSFVLTRAVWMGRRPAAP